MYTYTPHDVCSKNIEFDIKDGKVSYCRFNGGCSGNTQGIASLVTGMSVDEVVEKLEGIKCAGRGRGSSCPDQLAKALKNYKEEAL